MTDALGQADPVFLRSRRQPVEGARPRGNPTTYTYDAINRRLTITDAQPATTSYPVRPGRQSDSAITDANGHTTSFAYDTVNRKISETYPDLSHNTITWTYDKVGNVMTRTDQKSQITTYTYSDLYFLTESSLSPVGTDTFTYDLSGRVLTGNTTSRHAGWNETFPTMALTALCRAFRIAQTISYVYNIPGRTRTLTYPGGRTITEQMGLPRPTGEHQRWRFHSDCAVRLRRGQ